jgi:hypothetical protein
VTPCDLPLPTHCRQCNLASNYRTCCSQCQLLVRSLIHLQHWLPSEDVYVQPACHLRCSTASYHPAVCECDLRSRPEVTQSLALHYHGLRCHCWSCLSDPYRGCDTPTCCQQPTPASDATPPGDALVLMQAQVEGRPQAAARATMQQQPPAPSLDSNMTDNTPPNPTVRSPTHPPG